MQENSDLLKARQGYTWREILMQASKNHYNLLSKDMLSFLFENLKKKNNNFRKLDPIENFPSEQLHPISAITVDPIFSRLEDAKKTRERRLFAQPDTSRTLESASREESRTDCVSNY